jgi:hypothetical protein
MTLRKAVNAQGTKCFIYRSQIRLLFPTAEDVLS